MGAFRACVAFVLLQGAFSYRLPSMTTRQIVASNVHAPSRTLSPKMIEFDSNTLAAVGALVLGLGGGVALIAFTENAGKRNEQISNNQPCVECKGAKVVACTVCQGSGSDPYAELVAGVREMTGDKSQGQKVVVEDWASGPKEVIMYEEILKNYPPKVTSAVCEACSGRGVVVCDNCQGTGIQPRFLERYSPDDFMD